MRLVMKPAMPPTQGPARMPPRMVPIESRNSGSFKLVAIAWHTQSIAMHTGISTIPSVLNRSLKAFSKPIAIPAESIRPPPCPPPEAEELPGDGDGCLAKIGQRLGGRLGHPRMVGTLAVDDE